MFLNNILMNEGYQSKFEAFSAGKGSNIFINKRKFLDLSLCAGSIILGHNSKVFKKSLNDISKNNISNFAAKNYFAKNFSLTLKKMFPNYDKFIFCNSGTEAVFKSLRVARAITKKNVIISVTGSWHGSTSELLYSTNKNLKPIPLSSGLDINAKKNIKFIPYNDVIQSKKILDKYKKKIMCIIIEPIQGCLPLMAKKYLKFLENYSKKNNLILIFDEMITGLRLNASSAQNYLNIRPSISTFGKCFGGGLPIGIIALRKDVVKKILKKNISSVFFGGTFSGNSINTYLGNQITKYIVKNKRKIFIDLEKKSNYLEKELNNFFKLKKFDARCLRVSSMLRLVFTNNQVKNRYQRDFFEKKKNTKITKFRNYLFSKNIYYPSSGIIFIGNSTSYKDLGYLIKIIKLAFDKFFK